MSKMIQIRHVPDSLHRTLKVQAARSGRSLSDYLLGELRLIAQRPTLEELRERIASRRRAEPDESAADAVRAERDARESSVVSDGVEAESDSLRRRKARGG